MATWRDQVALVTGGGRGIGRAIARRLAREGASVCVNYLSRADAAESLVADINANGGHAIAVAADVADDAAVEGMVDRVSAAFGPVTILVNNAGVSYQATLESYDPEKLERMRQVNGDGVIHTTRAVMNDMRRQKYGRIVNITSIAALGTSLPGNAFYAATKAEAQILTLRFALELGSFGITVNAVAPGYVQTEMTRGADEEAWKERAQEDRCVGDAGAGRRPGRYRECRGILRVARIGLGDRAGAGSRRRPHGLSWTVVGAGNGICRWISDAAL